MGAQLEGEAGDAQLPWPPLAWAHRLQGGGLHPAQALRSQPLPGEMEYHAQDDAEHPRGNRHVDTDKLYPQPPDHSPSTSK